MGALSIGILSTVAVAVPLDASRDVAAVAFNLRLQQREASAFVLRKLAQADVVYLGETHDRPADHQAQLEIIQALQQLRPELAIGMEMFQRPYQSVLNRYLAGALTEAELQTQSQYQNRWGYPWDFYAPILRFAQSHQLPVIALNTPTEITRKTARTGLKSLTLTERRFIPPPSAVVLGPQVYRDRLQKIYGAHDGSASLEQFFQAQVLWDETMAERIAQTLQQQPKRLVVVLVGQGHLLYGDGIPARVARRVQATRSRAPFTQISLLFNVEAPEIRRDRQIADYIWSSQAIPAAP
ncbi:ChaN family lipoprotein [Stenomitos frigidus]|uniref:Iron-regulated protein n=1 Tax=Stenomitos frigidus ULC18 TaxID=2107698 RepID=A0A2T1ES53_9CYAN|nr:ChaN family lipoprotein [Stenomitos frigidus]PSB35586.1 iron-regulated protein [Stenomitos frigidus ULC18]